MLVETFDEQCNPGLYYLKYHPRYHIKKDIRRFNSQSVLDSNLYEYFNVQIKKA